MDKSVDTSTIIPKGTPYYGSSIGVYNFQYPNHVLELLTDDVSATRLTWVCIDHRIPYLVTSTRTKRVIWVAA